MKNQRKTMLGEALDVVADVASEVQTAVQGARSIGPAAGLWQWLQTEKSISGVMARSIILTQAPPELALQLADHWRGKGLAIEVVNRPPPRIRGRNG